MAGADLGRSSGPAANLDRALPLAQTETIDIAILDVNLGSEANYEVAEILMARGIPFVFVTGNAASIAERSCDAEVVVKPLHMAALIAALRVGRAVKASATSARPVPKNC